MFGLDARIALAIFGALSVISGAALYSAIQQANTMKAVMYFENMAKAYQGMYLDTGLHDIEINKAGCYIVINNPARAGWAGPYFPIQHAKTDCTATNEKFNLVDPIIKKFSVNAVPQHSILFEDFKSSTGWGQSCTATDCAIYTYTYLATISRKSGVTNDDIIADLAKVDEIIDGGDGAADGNFRYSTTGVFWGYKVMDKK
jgi:type II secretory pathway pseudopilin PulG